MYREFIVNNFGNVHLKGFELLVKACEMYSVGMTTMEQVYKCLADERPGVSRHGIERSIRSYIHALEPRELERCLPRMYTITNKSVIAGIVTEANREAAKQESR